MLYVDGLALLPDWVSKVAGVDSVDVVRDYCRISHIKVSLRQDLQD